MMNRLCLILYPSGIGGMGTSTLAKPSGTLPAVAQVVADIGGDDKFLTVHASLRDFELTLFLEDLIILETELDSLLDFLIPFSNVLGFVLGIAPSLLVG